MNLPRPAATTVNFIEQYCAAYQEIFPEVRSFECFKWLHLGMISQIIKKNITSDSQDSRNRQCTTFTSLFISLSEPFEGNQRK
jgi:SRSO17 transposase